PVRVAARQSPRPSLPRRARRREMANLRRHRRSSGAASAAPERAAGDRGELDRLVASLPDLDKPRLLLGWRNHLGGTAPAHLPSWLLARLLAFRLQTQAFGDVSAATLRNARRGQGRGSLIPQYRPSPTARPQRVMASTS